MHETKETSIVQLIFEKSSWLKTYIHVIKLKKYNLLINEKENEREKEKKG